MPLLRITRCVVSVAAVFSIGALPTAAAGGPGRVAPATMYTLIPVRLPGDAVSGARAVDDAGNVAGESKASHVHCSAPLVGAPRVFIYHASTGRYTTLGRPPGFDNAGPVGIWGSGHVAVNAQHVCGQSANVSVWAARSMHGHTVWALVSGDDQSVWTDGVNVHGEFALDTAAPVASIASPTRAGPYRVTTLTHSRGMSLSSAYAVDEDGRVAGSQSHVRSGSGFPTVWIAPNRPVLLHLGAGYTSGFAAAIAEGTSGGAEWVKVAGMESPPNGANWSACYWVGRSKVEGGPISFGRAHSLGSPPGFGASYANGVSPNGSTIVGTASVVLGGSKTTAFMWRDGKATNLSTLVPSNSPWTLISAYAVNNAGEIVGDMTARAATNGVPTAGYLLTRTQAG
jgi:hypothetical protein